MTLTFRSENDVELSIILYVGIGQTQTYFTSAWKISISSVATMSYQTRFILIVLLSYGELVSKHVFCQ